jgi:GGDEF domain-containing protein
MNAQHDLPEQSFKGYLLSSNDLVVSEILAVFPQGSPIDWIITSDVSSVMECLLLQPPDIILVDINLPGIGGLSVVQLIKGENVYRPISVILCLSDEDLDTHALDWSKIEVDALLFFPNANHKRLQAHLQVALGRASRNEDSNPLTHLPGNTAIIRYIQKLIESDNNFGMAYADLDNFKSFNDKYGFARGDEILMLTGRLIANTVREMDCSLSFTGHVGGDDFVFVLPDDQIEECCRRVLRTFDAVMPGFYDEDDRAAGKIISTDRQGNICSFPLMSVSVAVVFNINGSLSHYGEASERASTLKTYAKSKPGSVYVLDRRK